MSKVRINDLAREMEVKSRQVLDILAELGLASGKTHSSSLEDYEAEKVRAHFERGSTLCRVKGVRSASRAPQGIAPKIDLSHISKPGDVMKAILAKQQEQEEEARRSHYAASSSGAAAGSPPTPSAVRPTPPVVVAAPPPPGPFRPEKRSIVPQPRQAPPIVAASCRAARHRLAPPRWPGHCQGSSGRCCSGSPGGSRCTARGGGCGQAPRATGRPCCSRATRSQARRG